jgi:hypothetical protein
MEAMPSQALRVDTPPRELTADTDAFGHRDYAKVVTNTVLSVKTPFTLGLFGPWGSGKSTVLDEVGRRVKKSNKAAYVQFDVWRYEGDALRRQFLLDVVEQLREQRKLKLLFSPRRLLWDLESEATKPAESSLRFDGWGLARAAILTLVAGGLGVGLLLLLHGQGVNGDAFSGAAATISAAVLAFVLAAAGGVIRVDQTTRTTPRIQDADQFQRLFRRLLRSGVRADRLVIAIDNLDRCSPGRVAELLATIKTFLEPAEANKDLVFVIAADDEALHRHLEGQELVASGARRAGDAAVPPVGEVPGDGEPGEDGADMEQSQEPRDDRSTVVEDRVRDAVDEYLRKFFNGSVRISEFLQEDVFDFTRGELNDLIEARLADDADRVPELVSMIASQLRRNPRTIKQFVNELDLRLSLLEARQQSGAIQDKVSDNVLLAAKLLLIEKRWPHAYEDLREDPRLLKSLTQRVSQEELNLAPEYVNFLLGTQSIVEEDTGAFTRLKQERIERDLPRYRDFRDGLLDNDMTNVADVVEEADEEKLRAYARQTQTLFEEWLRRGFLSPALNCLRAILDVEKLARTHPATTEHIIRRSADHLALRRRIGEVPAGPLIHLSADALADPPYRRVVVAAAEALSEADVADFCDALLRADREPTGPSAEAVRNALEQYSRQIGDYVELVEKWPDLLPPSALKSAAERVQEDEMTLVGSDDALGIARVAVKQYPDQEATAAPLQELISHLRDSIIANAAQESTEESQALASIGVELAASGAIDVGTADNELDQLQDNSEFFQAAGEDGFNYGMALAERSSDGETRCTEVTSGFFRHVPAVAVRSMASRYAQLPAVARSVADTQLRAAAIEELGGVDQETAGAAVDTLVGVHGESAADVISEVVREAANSHRFEQAIRVINRANQNLDAAGLGASVQAVVEVAAPQNLEALNAVAELDPSLIRDQVRDPIASPIRDLLVNPQTQPQGEQLFDLFNQNRHQRLCQEIATQATQHLIANPGQVPSVGALVGFLTARRDYLDDDVQHQLAAQLKAAAIDPGAEHAGTGLVALRDSVPYEERGSWVTDLVNAERSTIASDVARRVMLLTAGRDLAGPQARSSAEPVKKRRAELKKSSSSEDQQVFEAVR